MIDEAHIDRIRRRAASYRKVAGTRQSAEARALYLEWATNLEKRADEMAKREVPPLSSAGRVR